MPSRALIAIAVAATLLAGCGDEAAEPGSPANPLVADRTQEERAGRTNEASAPAGETPGYQSLVERQSGKPASRFTPCLVSRAQAGSILGAPVASPVEAPQGPTCIYRSETTQSLVTMAIQSLDFDELGDQLRSRHSFEVAERKASCGVQGQPTLHVSLTRGRVLTVTAPCGVARRFAAAAVAQLRG